MNRPKVSLDGAGGQPGPDFDKAAEDLRPGRFARHPRLREAVSALESGRTTLAVKVLQDFLNDNPHDVHALHLLAEISLQHGQNEKAERLLVQCLALAPKAAEIRFGYARVLLKASKPVDALAQIEDLLLQQPHNPMFRALKAVALEATEDYETAALLWREMVREYPAREECWISYGNVLRAIGRTEEAVGAYRKVLEINPSSGSAYWALADLKTFQFGDADIQRMEALLVQPNLSADDRTKLHFALGKAYASSKLHEKSFGHYAKGNAIHRLGIKHDPGLLTAHVQRCKRVFTAEFFRDRGGFGCKSQAPIFIVGMPRSGSTLVEQILASHSQIEGTRELSGLEVLLRSDSAWAGNLETLKNADAAKFEVLGERYLEMTRHHRKLGRQFFTDKMGANFVHVGLIHLILPNAKIVDVRRHPMACCFSVFSQLFPQGQNDAYRLSDIGNLYRNYVDLLAHFDRVLPGRVHRVYHERLVETPEAEIRALLHYLNLPFEEMCLEFHKTKRAVTTASSEQVRSPLTKDGLDQWRSYERWLGPLADALGSVITAYPGVPDDLR